MESLGKSIGVCAFALAVLMSGDSHSSEAVMRSMSSLKSGMESFRAAMESRLSGLESQLQDCEGGFKYGQIRHHSCSAGEVGMRLEQCQNGTLVDTVNTCAVPRQQYARGPGDGRVNPRLPGHLNIDEEAGELVGRSWAFMSSDLETLSEFCKVKGFLGVESHQSFAFRSCGNDSLVGFDRGEFDYYPAPTLGCTMALHVICTNEPSDVVPYAASPLPAGSSLSSAASTTDG